VDAYYLVSQSFDAPTNAVNLGLLTSGVLQQSVSGGVSVIGALQMSAGRVPYGAASGGQLTQSSALVWDDSKHFLGIGTSTPRLSGATQGITLSGSSSGGALEGQYQSGTTSGTLLGIYGYNGTTLAASLTVLGGGATDSGSVVVSTKDTALGLSQRFRIRANGQAQWFNAPFVSLTSSSTPLAQANGTVFDIGITPPAQASAAGLILDAIKFDAITATLTGTTHVTTSTGFNLVDIERPTYTDSSAVTVDYGATVAIKGAPVAGGSLTLTNAYALWVQQGATRLSGDAIIGGTTYTNAVTAPTGNLSLGAPGHIDVGADVLPTITASLTLGNSSKSWNGYFGTVTVDTAIQGGAGSTLALQNAASPTTAIALTGANIQITGDMAPTVTFTQSLGSAAKPWNNVVTEYVTGGISGLNLNGSPTININAGIGGALVLDGAGGTVGGTGTTVGGATDKVAFFAVAPVARQTGGAATAGGSYTATEQGMINRMYSAMRNYGLLT
jgi:hypothetical protein